LLESSFGPDHLHQSYYVFPRNYPRIHLLNHTTKIMECSAGTGSNDISVQGEPCFDVVIIGFGPAALAQAIALYEQRKATRNILIMDKSSGFSWRGRDLPNDRARMRTNLMQDLVTARNPTSEFTFVNYLWATENLVGYTNLGLMNPPRQLFGMYLEWCANKVSSRTFCL
jgi:L-ornithine N5-oxygenase